MMRKIRLSGLIWLGVLIVSCAPSPSVNSSADRPAISPPPTADERAQMLPISATAIMGGETIELEVAQTPEQQATGLMYRADLAKNRGMLFPFDPPRQTRFWMKNVTITLDMVFLREGEIIAIFADVPPCTTTPCPTYGPTIASDSVIELAGGRAAELGIETGDRVNIQFLEIR